MSPLRTWRPFPSFFSFFCRSASRELVSLGLTYSPPRAAAAAAAHHPRRTSAPECTVVIQIFNFDPFDAAIASPVLKVTRLNSQSCILAACRCFVLLLGSRRTLGATSAARLCPRRVSRSGGQRGNDDGNKGKKTKQT